MLLITAAQFLCQKSLIREVVMSIDPTGLTNVTAGFHPTKVAHQPPTEGRSAFDAELSSAANLLKNNDKSVSAVIEQVKLSQVKMLQGLFSVESDDESDDFLSGMEGLINFQRLSLQESQIVDKYASQQHYTLRKRDEKTGSDINSLIDRVAEKVSLAPELIHSIVSAESAYNPTAVSNAGAQGLMQLMPGTAAELGVKDSFDPAQNLMAGSKYLKQLLDKYDGDLDHALAAYNWGQGNVDRHGLENMPQETCDYLVKVKALLKTQSS